jgi:rhodanese-related sulfurtransferase
MTGGVEQDHSGDISARETWQRLKSSAEATLIDVRTRAEWSFVGIADLSTLGKECVLLEWQSYPGMELNAGFIATLEAELARRGVGTDAQLFFMCRSGVRSAAAARMARGAGWEHCFNVAAGFEGNMDEQRHRGLLAGWKAEGLPWIQS